MIERRRDRVRDAALESLRSCRASSRRHPGACHAAGRIWPSSSSIWFGFYVAYQVARGAADRERRARVPERRVGPAERERDRRALRAGRSARRRHARRSSSRSRRTRTGSRSSRSSALDAALGLLPPPRALRRLPQLADPARERDRARRLRPDADRAAADVPGAGASSTRSASSRRSTTTAASIAFAANPYAAMPSLHAMDALIVGDRDVRRRAARSSRRRSGSLWPAWVWFAVMATGNHFWLDVVAGFVLAIVTGLVLSRTRLLAPAARVTDQEPAPEPRVSQLDRVKQEYTQAAPGDPPALDARASRRRS